MSTTIIIETDAQESTVIAFPDAVPTTVEVQTQYAQNFARPEKIIVEPEDAVAGDEFKSIILDGENNSAEYTIDPALFTGLTLYISGGDDVTQGAKVIADSGVIKLKSGEDLTEVDVQARQPITLYSDGTNLKEK